MDVVRIAHLARLSLTSDEQNAMNEQMQNIFQWIDALKNFKGEDEVKPGQPVMQERSDEHQEQLSPEALLANAPQQSYGMFSVPKVVETV